MSLQENHQVLATCILLIATKIRFMFSEEVMAGTISMTCMSLTPPLTIGGVCKTLAGWDPLQEQIIALALFKTICIFLEVGMAQRGSMTFLFSILNNLFGHKLQWLARAQLQEQAWNFVTWMTSFSCLEEVDLMRSVSMICTPLIRNQNLGSTVIISGMLRTTQTQKQELVTRWLWLTVSSTLLVVVMAKTTWRTCIS